MSLGYLLLRYADEFDIPKRNSSELVLGKDCLQLTIVKPTQKGEQKTIRPVLEAKLKRRNVTKLILLNLKEFMVN